MLTGMDAYFQDEYSKALCGGLSSSSLGLFGQAMGSANSKAKNNRLLVIQSYLQLSNAYYPQELAGQIILLHLTE